MNSAVNWRLSVLLIGIIFVIVAASIDWAIKTTNNLPAVIYSVGLVTILCGLIVFRLANQPEENQPVKP